MTLPQTVETSAVPESMLQKCTVCKFKGPPEAFSGRKLCPSCREYYRNRAANQKKVAEIQAANVDSDHRCCTSCFQVKLLAEYDGTKKTCNPCLAYCKTKYKKANGRTCTECGYHRLVSEFTSQQRTCNTCLPQPKAVYDAKQVGEASTQDHDTGRLCPRCHRRKPSYQFTNFREICNPSHGNSRKLLDNVQETEKESRHFGSVSGERDSGLQIVRLHPELEQVPDRQNESVTNTQNQKSEGWPEGDEPSLLRDLMAYAQLEEHAESPSVGNSHVGKSAQETKINQKTLESNVEKKKCAACRTYRPLDAFAGTRKCCIRCLSRYRTKYKRPGIDTPTTDGVEIKQYIPLAPQTTKPPARCRWCDTLCPTDSGRKIHLLFCQILTHEIESLEKQLFGDRPSDLYPGLLEDQLDMAPSREVKWLLCKMMVDDPSTRPFHGAAEYKMLVDDTSARPLDDEKMEIENEDNPAETQAPKDNEHRTLGNHQDDSHSRKAAPTALEFHEISALYRKSVNEGAVPASPAQTGKVNVQRINASLTTPSRLVLHEISDPNFERVSQSAEPERLSQEMDTIVID